MPNIDIANIGIWDQKIASDPDKVQSFNVSGSQVTKEQIIQLYLLLFPYIVAEFAHRDQLYAWAKKQLDEMKLKIEQFNAQMSALISYIGAHVHTSGAPGTPTSPPIISPSSVEIGMWSTLPEDNIYDNGEKLIVNRSSYTSAIKHRDPQAGLQYAAAKSPLTPSIVEDFTSSKKRVPFAVKYEATREELNFIGNQ